MHLERRFMVERERERETEREMKLKHLLHKHQLTLCNYIDDELVCPGCGDLSFDESYSCSKCRFYPKKCYACNDKPSGSFYFCQSCWPNSPLIHKSCAELPQKIQITFHPHSLYFKEESSTSHVLDCDFCYRTKSYYRFFCKDCDFQIHVGCAAMLFEYHEGREHIKHFSHQHPLTQLDVSDANYELCDKNICGPTYACSPCGFCIHKSCGELQQEVEHPFHPRHCLTLNQPSKSRESFQCEACRSYIVGGLHYRCNKCDFNLHPECVSLTPNIKCKGHEHLLTLIERFHKSVCQACGSEIMDVFFVRCVECRLNFHIECGPLQLPATVAHKQHRHPLSLKTETVIKDDYDLLKCDVCKEKRNSNQPFYCCDKCEYYAHVRCAVTEVQHEEREKLGHFSHHHFLFSCENKGNDKMLCYACEQSIFADLAYGCNFCKLYLHKSCAELPRHIKHPCHSHRLALREAYSREGRVCDACGKHCYGFTYRCNDCDFDLDLDCALLYPSIKFEGHKHKLTLFDRFYDVPKCQHCKFTPSDASYLRCVECDFNIHLFCSPLPKTINHNSHGCSLILKDRLVDKNYDGQICDVCEKERNPEECVYYCEGCDFIAEFNCVISEVLRSLQRNSGDVPLRTLSKQRNDEVFRKRTYSDILKSCNEEKQEIMEEFQSRFKSEFEGISSSRNDDEGNMMISQNFPYSDVDLFRFMVKLRDDRWKIPLMEPEDVEDAVVNVGDYPIVSKLAPVLEKLLDKYGDIGANCHLNHGLKTVPLSIFCSTIQSMSKTKVVDVTDKLMYTWYCSLEFVREAKFETDFVFDHLKRIVQARYGTETENYKSGPIYKLHEKMAQLSEEIDQLTGEINKRSAKMDQLRKQTGDIISSFYSESSRLEAQHLSDALEFRRKNAATGLL